MKNDMKYIMGFTVLLAMGLSRFMVSKYGANSRVIISLIALIISMAGFIAILCVKQYMAAVATFFMFILPGAIMFMGIYLDNMLLAVSGLALIFIIIPIGIKVLNKYKK